MIVKVDLYILPEDNNVYCKISDKEGKYVADTVCPESLENKMGTSVSLFFNATISDAGIPGMINFNIHKEATIQGWEE